MAKQAEEQNIKSRARRRLIGAVALALAVVVILPMVLDSEPKISGKDIDLRIPAPEKSGEFVPGVAVSEVVETVSLAESSVASAVPEVTGVETKPLASASGKITLAETKPEAKVQAAASMAPETKQPEINKNESKSADSKPIETKKINPLEAKPAEKSAATYIVQVGAFANAGTATQEADKLKSWGFKSYTEQISGTTRVRVGPYTDRKKADEVRQMLEKHGLHPAVTAVNGHSK